jgi:hypothetical protein
MLRTGFEMKSVMLRPPRPIRPNSMISSSCTACTSGAAAGARRVLNWYTRPMIWMVMSGRHGDHGHDAEGVCQNIAPHASHAPMAKGSRNVASWGPGGHAAGIEAMAVKILGTQES